MFVFVMPVRAQTITQGVPPIDTLAQQAIIVEAATGYPLFEKNAQDSMPTSSMSKIMTMYLVFEAIKNGKFDLQDKVTTSNAAFSQPGSRSFLKSGQKVTVEDLIRGVVVQSGNDAAVALAEAVAGSEGSFASVMNAKAKQLGLQNSFFRNATGLPDPGHFSTARDLALLAYSLIRDFPDQYHYYGEKEFTFNKIKQGNRNPLLYRNMGVDGMKTGHTEAAGYGLVASALREGRRVIVVVNGLGSMQKRADESAKLIEWAYREFEVQTYLRAGDKVGEAPLWLGESKTVSLTPARNVTFSIPRGAQDKVKVALVINPETQAPIQKGRVLGKAIVSGEGLAPFEVPLVAMEDVKPLGFFASLWARFKRLIGWE